MLRKIEPNSRVLDIGCFNKWAKSHIDPSCTYLGLDYFDTATQWYGSVPDIYGDAMALPHFCAVAVGEVEAGNGKLVGMSVERLQRLFEVRPALGWGGRDEVDEFPSAVAGQPVGDKPRLAGKRYRADLVGATEVFGERLHRA